MDRSILEWLVSKQPWRTRFGWLSIFRMAKRCGYDDRAARIAADVWARTGKVTIHDHLRSDRLAALEDWKRSKNESREVL